MSSSAKRICWESSRQLQSQVTTIENLCDDVLVEIFSYLSAKESKSATLVRKHWNEVIGLSAKSMKKFKLTIDGIKEEDFDYTGGSTNISSTRKHYNVEFWSDLVHPEKTLSFFNLSHVKNAKIQLSSRKFVMLALSRMPLLEDLEVYTGRSKVEDSTGPMVTLEKLKKIKISGRIISLASITAKNLIEIDVQAFAISTASDGEILANFLRHCKKITTMKLCAPGLTELFEATEWSECRANKWKLTSLSFIDHYNVGFNFDDGFKQFLIQQGPTLKSLSIEYYGSLPTDYFEEVFSHLIQLTSLTLKYRFDDCILRHLPGLRKLTVGGYGDIATSNIARFNRKLTFLSITCFSSATVKPLEDGLTFNNLKHLVIRMMKKGDDWISVVRSSPNIDTVEMSHSSHDFDTDDNTIDILLQRPTLRHLKLSSSNVERLDHIFNKIGSNPGSLKSLILNHSTSSQQIEFVFPDDPTEWNAAEQQKRFHKKFGVKPKFGGVKQKRKST